MLKNTPDIFQIFPSAGSFFLINNAFPLTEFV